jgi:hypothetical protein
MDEKYTEQFQDMMGVFVNEIGPNIPGDVVRYAETIVDLLSSEETAGRLPVRVVLGGDAAGVVKQKCEEQLQLLEEYAAVTKRVHHDDGDSSDLGGTLKLTSMHF